MVKSQAEFPSLDTRTKTQNKKSKSRMPKFIQKKQSVQKKQSKIKSTCDGDLMTDKKFGKVMAYHGVEITQKIQCDESTDCSCCKPLDVILEEEDDFEFMCGECVEEDQQHESQ